MDTVTNWATPPAGGARGGGASPNIFVAEHGIFFSFPGVPGVRCAFGTLQTGSLALREDMEGEEKARVVANRAALPATFGFGAWAEAHQVHGVEIVVEPEAAIADQAPIRDADGMFATRVDLALACKTADCQPLLLTCKDGRAVAALHVGWRGNARNFPAIGVRAFCERYGLRPAEVFAVRGPSLGPEAAEFRNFDREWADEFRPWFDEKRLVMDLWSLTRHQLEQAGVPEGQIFGLDLCTKTLPERFFSYRRRDTGRQMSFIWRKRL